MKRNVYLQSTNLDKVNVIIDSLMDSIQFDSIKETIAVKESLNRVSAKAVYAKVSNPYYNASAMDGIALKAELTYDATETTPVILQNADFVYVNTGNEIPNKFNAVVMIEEVYELTNGSIQLLKSVKPYQDIRPIGEDIVKGDRIISKNHLIRPVDISAMLSGGIKTVDVIKKPTVAIIPTGDEIITDSNEIEKGKIIDSNSYFIKNKIQLLGGSATIFDVTVDQYNVLEEVILNATKKYDLVIIGAGSSAGSKDFAKDIVQKHGDLLVHGISIKPGKPTIVGKIYNTPIVGLPGYPVSTFIAFDLVVKKIVQSFLHQDYQEKTMIKARLTKKIYSSLKNREYIRVKVGVINDEFIVTPLDRGAGVTMSLVKADGMLIIERNSEGYLENSIVDVELLKDLKEIKKSLIVVGSHDVILDKVDDLMTDFNFHLSSSHVGSYGGIKAIKSKGCQLAPVHVLGPDGVYNEFILKEYLDDNYSLLKGVLRVQGLYVKKGNPKNIHSLKDLTRKDVVFVNRQRGSGTRILLDHLLEKNNIDSDKITGYEFELATHTLVASSVKDDRFDCGMGILSVAKMNELDFIEIGVEHYDFLILNEIIDTPIYNTFIKVLRSKEFKMELNKLGGYVIENIGEIISGMVHKNER